MGFGNPLKATLPLSIRTGVWASLVSSVMLIGIGVFWVVLPGASEGAFAIEADTAAAEKFARIAAIFKAVGDVLPAVFVLIALYRLQFRLVGYFQLATIILVVLIDILTWRAFVPDPSIRYILMHVPFAIPMAIAAFCFLIPHNSYNEQ